MQIDGIDVCETILRDGREVPPPMLYPEPEGGEGPVSRRPGSAPPLLFLHGWGVGHDSYGSLLTRLSETHTVYAPDMPGFGKTPEPSEPWDVDRYADFVLAYCKARGLTGPVMMGHSNGGRVLLCLLSRDFPGVTPPRVVLFDAAGLKRGRGLRVYFKVYTYKAVKIFLKPFPKALERYRAGRGSADYRAASPLMKATMSKLLAADLSDALPRIKAPTLLIWGEDDTATPLADGRRMEREIPDAGLAVLPGGHWAFMERLPHTMRILDSFL
ncbi:MAG: alpha/beta hydrolase [Oscillospiraceae bacterium]|jgi:pimeloyl-ACP methyl ester carboxylesterase|nr:alpha/beta hydrolase [Oscillospiraceae bacterium]